MNVKVRMPKFGISKKPNGQRGWVKELLLTILATSISIVLTFGTAYLIERHQKLAARHQMAMMIIHDIDESINQMEKVDSILREFDDLQLKILQGKYSRPIILATADLIQRDPAQIKFAETTERIFASNVDTWSTIGKADFIDNVSRCYIDRAEFQKEVIDAFHKQLGLNDSEFAVDLDSLLNIDSGYFVVYASNIINRMKAANELNKQIMGVSDNDLEKFSTRIVGFDEEELDSLGKVGAAEYVQRVITKEAAMENYLKNKDAMYPDMRSGSK